MIPLTKVFTTADYPELAPELAVVEAHGGEALAKQHEQRRWEYAMALRAYTEWQRTTAWHLDPIGLDVGGAASPLPHLFTHLGYERNARVAVCDPTINLPVERYAEHDRGPFDLITSISTIEHVPEVEPFLDALVTLLAPGGLLFLTTDYWDGKPEAPDTAHFHWMRERIYTRESWLGVASSLCGRGLAKFGSCDLTYPGAMLFGSYTMASLALVKR